MSNQTKHDSRCLRFIKRSDKLCPILIKMANFDNKMNLLKDSTYLKFKASTEDNEIHEINIYFSIDRTHKQIETLRKLNNKQLKEM